MKIVSDSIEVKSRLRRYKPSLSSKIIQPDESYNYKKLEDLSKELINCSDTNDKTQLLLYIADEIVKQDGVKAYAVCQHGCAHCCKIHVSVTALEAYLIGQEIGKNPVQRKVQSKNDYCQFLDKNNASCTIYKVRPLHCRSFHSLDHYEYCTDLKIEHLIFKTAYSVRLLEIEKTLQSGSRCLVADIREWF
ncbi:YkgJ family cysteine cluster protein [Trabulsiella odontotermitis]|uniref:YkgJ family cysteine cluster protein n=1 Tax=Trabulsiella odontotermitis TaxID=379893 RepID=UPI000ADBE6CE|nr:YkgJ family cysteine cluster protein [Trabulsiella odontotermitis]